MPMLNGFSYLMLAHVLTDWKFSCLAVLAKPYPESGPTYLPQIPNQLHCMTKGALEVLQAISEAKRLSPFTIN